MARPWLALGLMDIKNLLQLFEDIEKLAIQLHGDKEAATEYTIQSMKDHANEIAQLIENKNEHWKAETIDQLIHCVMLLNRYEVSSEEIHDRLLQRRKKFNMNISQAIESQQNKNNLAS